MQTHVSLLNWSLVVSQWCLVLVFWDCTRGASCKTSFLASWLILESLGLTRSTRWLVYQTVRLSGSLGGRYLVDMLEPYGSLDTSAAWTVRWSDAYVGSGMHVTLLWVVGTDSVSLERCDTRRCSHEGLPCVIYHGFPWFLLAGPHDCMLMRVGRNCVVVSPYFISELPLYCAGHTGTEWGAPFGVGPERYLA